MKVIGNKKKGSVLTALFIILFMHCVINAASAEIDWSLCDLNIPEEAFVGETITIDYDIKSGLGEGGTYLSGNYSNLTLRITPVFVMTYGGSQIGQEETLILEESSGTCNVVMPGGTEASVEINGTDNITGRSFFFRKDIKLKQNPNYPVTFAVDSFLHNWGETITVYYNLEGYTGEPVNITAWWASCEYGSSPHFPIDTQYITETSGSDSYYTENEYRVVFALSGTDQSGNPIFASSDEIHVSPRHDHIMNHFDGCEATCIREGMNEYWYCVICDTMFNDAEGNEYLSSVNTIPRKNHIPVSDPAVVPTYSTPGLTEGLHCDVCGEIINEQLEIPAISDMTVLRTPYELKAIDFEAFSNLTCQAIIISEGCTDIAERAFAGCNNLLYVKLPASIKNYPPNAFEGCNENLFIHWAEE